MELVAVDFDRKPASITSLPHQVPTSRVSYGDVACLSSSLQSCRV